ncbi:hypothetical protein SAMN05443246_3262 [Paenibacillus sp. GP183]|nr:hypothetical protein SAMN05443246_3262 [Paenibacillus sp. GP183]
MIPSILNNTLYPTQETIEAVFPSPIKWRGRKGELAVLSMMMNILASP